MQQSHSLKPWTVEAEGSLTLVSVLCFLKGPVPSLMPFGYCWAPGRNVIRAEQMKHQDSDCGISTEFKSPPWTWAPPYPLLCDLGTVALPALNPTLVLSPKAIRMLRPLQWV